MIGQRTVHPRRWAAAAGLVALGLTASCGVRVDSTRTVGTTGAHRQQAASGQVVEASYAKQAAAATSDMRTARFKLTTSGSGHLGSALDISATGAYDLDAEATQLDVDLGSLGGHEEMVVVDGKAYLKLPAGLGSTTDKPWLALDAPTSKLGSNPLGTMDPKAMLDELKSITGDLTVVGHETIDGVDTTHYHGTIDPSKAPGATQGAAPKLFGSITMPVDVWIDDQGLLRRQQLSITAPAGSADSGASSLLGGFGLTLTIEFTDLGAPVTITAPPADQVQTVDPKTLAKRFGNGSSLPGAAAN